MTEKEHTRGDTLVRAWTLVDKNTGTSISLLGASARMHIRNDKDELIVEASTQNGKMTIAKPNKLTVRFEAEDMRIPVGTYYFDVEITYEDGLVQTIEQGKLKIIKDWTY